MPPSLPPTKDVVALSFMEHCRRSCYQRGDCSGTALKTKKLYYSWRKWHHRLISLDEGWWINLTSSSKPKCSYFLADYSWFSLHCWFFFLVLTQDRRGHESWWKFQLCSIQWTCTQQNLKSLITYFLSTPQQDTRVIYVHNRINKDVDYLGYKWASVTVTHCSLQLAAVWLKAGDRSVWAKRENSLKKTKQTKNPLKQTNL